MNKLAMAVLGGVVLVGGALSSQAQGAWKEFRSAQGRFSCNMPGTPKYEKSQVPTKVGSIASHMYTAATSNRVFVAGYADYPAAQMKSANPAKVVAGAQDGVLKKLKGKITSQRAMKIGKYPGKEFACTAPNDIALKARIYLVNNRLYQALALTPTADAGSPDVNKFLDSLKVTAK